MRFYHFPAMGIYFDWPRVTWVILRASNDMSCIEECDSFLLQSAFEDSRQMAREIKQHFKKASFRRLQAYLGISNHQVLQKILGFHAVLTKGDVLFELKENPALFGLAESTDFVYDAIPLTEALQAQDMRYWQIWRTPKSLLNVLCAGFAKTAFSMMSVETASHALMRLCLNFLSPEIKQAGLFYQSKTELYFLAFNRAHILKCMMAPYQNENAATTFVEEFVLSMRETMENFFIYFLGDVSDHIQQLLSPGECLIKPGLQVQKKDAYWIAKGLALRGVYEKH